MGFLYYSYMHEKAITMGRWNEHQQPTGTTTKLRKDLIMPAAPFGGQQLG